MRFSKSHLIHNVFCRIVDSLTKGTEQSRQRYGGQCRCHNLTAGSHVVHESTRLSVRSVDGTQEAPGLRQQLTHRGGPHFGERCPSVHTAEVRQVADKVELVGYHTKACILQDAETCGQRGK